MANNNPKVDIEYDILDKKERLFSVLLEVIVMRPENCPPAETPCINRRKVSKTIEQTPKD